MMETNKYIIELEEMIVSTADGQMPLYKIKGFNTPTFDSDGVSKLIPYTELDVKTIRDEAYDKGLNDGWTNVHNECEAAYQKGLYNAWDVARKISIMDSPTRDEIFGLVVTSNIIDENSALEAIEKIRKYEQEQDEIKVGNEVDSKGCRGTITKISYDGDHFNVMWENGSTGYYMIEDFKKTGRHFPEIVDVLRKMQEVRE